MRSPAVQSVFRTLWTARRDGGGRIAVDAVPEWGRRLAAACAADAGASPDYSPEEDRRVLWAREVLQAARRRELACHAAADLEMVADFMLTGFPELCGKDMAAGAR